MVTCARNLVVALFVSVVVLVTLGSIVSVPTAEAQQRTGLVDVEVGGITTRHTISEYNVPISVAAQIVADVCPNLHVADVAALAVQVNRTNQTATTTCTTIMDQSAPVTITSA